MPKKITPTEQEQVDNYIQTLNHPLKDIVLQLKHIALDTHANISVQIKWNSLSFYYNGDMKAFDPKEYKRDIVVYNLRKQDEVLLVFPTGSILQNPNGFLGGKFADTRKTAIFKTMQDVNDKEQDYRQVLLEWLEKVEK